MGQTNEGTADAVEEKAADSLWTQYERDVIRELIDQEDTGLTACLTRRHVRTLLRNVRPHLTSTYYGLFKMAARGKVPFGLELDDCTKRHIMLGCERAFGKVA